MSIVFRLVLQFVLFTSCSMLILTDFHAQDYSQEQKVVAPNRKYNDRQGTAVSIQGKTIISGAWNKDVFTSPTDSLIDAGYAFIYQRSFDTWSFRDSLLAPDFDADDLFGRDVSIHGGYIAVGAPHEDEDESYLNTIDEAGSVYIYKEIAPGDWSFHQKIVAADRGTSWAFFGYSVELHDSILVVGAYGEGEDELGLNQIDGAGAAYVFELSSSGQWQETQKLVSSNRQFQDFFGSSVNVTAKNIFVGADFEDNGGQVNSGGVHVFEKNGSGIWIETAHLTSPINGALDLFGRAIDATDSLLIVGSDNDDEDENELNSIVGAGSAYVFRQNIFGTWLFEQKLVALYRGPNESFGHAVGIINDKIIISSPNDKTDSIGNNYLTKAGASHLFEFSSTTNAWELVRKSIAFDRGSNTFYGMSTAISENYIVSGAMWESRNELSTDSVWSAGALYINGSCIHTYDSIVINSCAPYPLPSGNGSLNIDGIYKDTILNSRNCDSIITINFIYTPLAPVLIQTGSILAATDTGSYLWVDCSSGYTIIPGETDSIFTPVSNGVYALILNQTPCSDTSSCYNITSVKIEETINEDIIRLYPNPVISKLFVDLGNQIDVSRVVLMNMDGSLVQDITISSELLLEIDMNMIATGSYLLRIISNNDSRVLKILKY
ncbi:MAG: T9SS type A sorting domain-containing protein [Crocinitomicaceae bacterium]|nr:T9SS type A sorting domain-containing protein [Crocinitomicaceae bacterium]